MDEVLIGKVRFKNVSRRAFPPQSRPVVLSIFFSRIKFCSGARTLEVYKTTVDALKNIAFNVEAESLSNYYGAIPTAHAADRADNFFLHEFHHVITEQNTQGAKGAQPDRVR